MHVTGYYAENAEDRIIYSVISTASFRMCLYMSYTGVRGFRKQNRLKVHHFVFTCLYHGFMEANEGNTGKYVLFYRIQEQHRLLDAFFFRQFAKPYFLIFPLGDISPLSLRGPALPLRGHSAGS